nr:rhombosortase [Shewanella sp. VB17]
MILLISLSSIILFYVSIDDLLAYERNEIALGEYWRLFTGNLLHTNIWHLVMNVAGLWVIILLHQQHYHLTGFTLFFITLCLLQGTGLYLFYPNVLGYIGLSGVLHGIFTYGAIKDIQVGMRSGYLLLIGVIIKVGHEQWFGASKQVTEMIGTRVAIEAHLVGTITGIILFFAMVFFKLILQRKIIKASCDQ